MEQSFPKPTLLVPGRRDPWTNLGFINDIYGTLLSRTRCTGSKNPSIASTAATGSATAYDSAGATTMRVVIFGGSGLIGQGVMLQTLDDPEVESVLSIGRRTLDVSHPKLRQLVHEDFLDFTPLAEELGGLDACFWCLGTASAGMSEEDYTRITYDFTMAAAKVLREQSPGICFCFISGAGTDDTEKGRMMWARVKGKTENALRRSGFERLYVFRPGFIKSTRGKTTRGSVARAIYAAVYPLLRPLGAATTNTAIGDAMLTVAKQGSDHEVLDSKAINGLLEAR